MASSSQTAHEKANASANTQIKLLTDLVKSVLKTMEEQKEEHTDHLETLMMTFTQQIVTLKAQFTGMTKFETQLSNIQSSRPQRMQMLLAHYWAVGQLMYVLSPW